MAPDVWSFHEKPYRHYRLSGETHTPAGLEILSVTQAIGVIDKSGPLQGYAAKMTIEGVAEILRRGAGDVNKPRRAIGAGELAALLRQARLTFRDRTSDAADRGRATHKALEDWINERRIPEPGNYPAHWRGFVRSLAAFLVSQRPEFLESERIVGSVKHGYAGACDTVAVVRGPSRGRIRLDLKTSKAVYPSSHYRQLAGYELADVEGGSEPTNAQGVVRLGDDGSWEVRYLQDLGDLDFYSGAFLRALAVCRDERAIKAAERLAQ